MSQISTKAQSGSPWRRRRLSASLIVLLLLGLGADFAPALAAGTGDPNLSVANSSSTLAGGTAKLIVGTLRRQGKNYVGGYVHSRYFAAESFPLFLQERERPFVCQDLGAGAAPAPQGAGDHFCGTRFGRGNQIDAQNRRQDEVVGERRR
ncbi:MAG: hypothetical protein ACR2NX_15520 [Chthoniobacterales bacterium]